MMNNIPYEFLRNGPTFLQNTNTALRNLVRLQTLNILPAKIHTALILMYEV